MAQQKESDKTFMGLKDMLRKGQATAEEQRELVAVLDRIQKEVNSVRPGIVPVAW